MMIKSVEVSLPVLLAAAVFACAAVAEEHTSAALEHADQAASSQGDSKSIADHAGEALKHIEDAKAANASNPHVIQHLEQSEADLKAAVSNAHRFNTDTAGRDAADAKAHLDAAHE
jgi:predicted membrane-bound mannosyltransferase